MTLRIMLLDMLKHRRLPERRFIPIQFPHPSMQGRVAATDIADVAFEMLHVDGVEADDGGVEADIGFGDGGAEVIRSFCVVVLLGEVGFGAVEGGEEGLDGGFVGGLGSG